MSFFSKFLPPEDRYAALLLYGMILPICFNGYDAGIMTVILADDQFIGYYGISPSRLGTVASIQWATIGGTMAAIIGRLWAIRVSICVTIIGVVIQIVPNTYSVLLLGRLLTGLGFGCIHLATCLYVAECAPKRLRGSFVGTVTQFGFQFGTLVAFWCGYGMSSYRIPENIAWRVSNAIQIPIGICSIVISFWYPESPRWILEKHPENADQVLNQLARLRSRSPEDEVVKEEFHELIASHEFRTTFDSGCRGIIKTPALRKRLCYGLYAMSLQQIGGIAVISIYAALIYESLGWNTGRQALAINGIQSVLQLLIVLVNTFTVEKYGRKKLLIWGFTIQSLALLILSSLATSFPRNGNNAAAVAEVAMLFIVSITYCWSNGPITPAIASEIFPQHVREKAFGLSLLGQTGCLLALVQAWPTFHAETGPKSYWLLFSLNASALISVAWILPETKGVSLERMDALFGNLDTVVAGEIQMRCVGNGDTDPEREELKVSEVIHVEAIPETISGSTAIEAPDVLAERKGSHIDATKEYV